MYRAFNVQLSDGDFAEHRARGRELLASTRATVFETLEACVRDDGYIDGARLRESWFPQLTCDIFISHSHADEGVALGLAGWLKERFQLRSFVDSDVWGHAGELLRQVDERYCLNPGGLTYDYGKRNRSTAHVHALLSTAWSDVQAAMAALDAPQDDPEAWRQGLERTFDAELFLRWLALNTVIKNWDTYGQMAHNYYLYGDPDSDGRLMWVPWDNNMA